jgi:hypothetical protein
MRTGARDEISGPITRCPRIPSPCRPAAACKTVVIAKKSAEIPFPKLVNNLSGMIGPIANVPMSIFGKLLHIDR